MEACVRPEIRLAMLKLTLCIHLANLRFAVGYASYRVARLVIIIVLSEEHETPLQGYPVLRANEGYDIFEIFVAIMMSVFYNGIS